MTMKPKDFPFRDCCDQVQARAAEGWLCFQKFTCSKCGQRLTMDRPNTMYETGSCDKCGTITNIRLQGCNFMMASPALRDILAKISAKE